MTQPLSAEAGTAIAPDVRFWYVRLRNGESAAVERAIASEHISQGPITAELERRLAAYLDVPYVVLTTSGSIALYLAYTSLGIGAGDEVIVPNRTFIATAHAALMCGATVRLVDCRPESTLIDHTQLEAAINERTKAIVPVHLNGNVADMDAIAGIAARHGIAVVEDAAQAFGSTCHSRAAGTFGDIGCFSLGVLKMITSGQGGFVATRDAQTYEKLLLLRSHGVRDTFVASYRAFGFNFKFNDILAAVALAQLETIERKIERHIQVYRWYERELRDIPFIRLLSADLHRGSVPLWVEALCSERDRVVDEMRARGIALRPFLQDLSDSPHLAHTDVAFANSPVFARTGVALPCGPDIAETALRRTIDALRSLRDEISPLAGPASLSPG